MRLLFITATRIGDAVLSTGVLEHFITQHPGLRVTVACGPVAASLFQAVPGLEAILPVRKRPGNLHWVKLWSQTVGHVWDQVVDLRASVIGYLVPARQRLVGGGRAGKHHRVEELGALLGIDPPPAPTVWLAARHEAEAERLIPPGGPVVAIGPAANWIGKQWRSERFAKLVQGLTDTGGVLAGARVAVLAIERERPQAQPVIEALPAGRVIDLVGSRDLLTVAACLRRCRLYIGNDSGLMHLAAAAGVPTLGLFGPSPEWRYAPWGPHAAYVRTPESFAELQARRDAMGEVRETMMGGLAVASVLEAAEALLQRTETV
jgi:ADP-heptose:LPS heptosyltransferase